MTPRQMASTTTATDLPVLRDQLFAMISKYIRSDDQPPIPRTIWVLIILLVFGAEMLIDGKASVLMPFPELLTQITSAKFNRAELASASNG